MSAGGVTLSLLALYFTRCTSGGKAKLNQRRVGVCGSIQSCRQLFAFARHTRPPAATSAPPPPSFSAGIAEFANQILNGPIGPRGLQLVRRRAVLPDGITN